MEKTLKKIQKVFKLGEVVSKIMFICSIVAIGGCILGIILWGVGFDKAIKIGGVTIRGMLDDKAGMSHDEMIFAMVYAIIIMAGELIVAKMTQLYFSHEQEAGTPFTYEGAKEIKSLGIRVIIVSGVTQGIAGIVGVVAGDRFLQEWGGRTPLESTVAFGIMFLVLSLIFRYGAEIQETEPAKKDS